MTSLTPQHSVSELCDLLEVARSGYYAWRRAQPRPRAQQNAQLLEHVGRLFQQHQQRYGSPRITAQLCQEGRPCNHKRIERLMRVSGLRVRTRKAWKPKTTDSQHDQPIAPNLLKDRAAPVRCDEVWVTDITYVPTSEGWLYLAGVLDLYSRKLIGHSLQDSLATDLPLQALTMALTHRGHPQNVIHHSDRGCQYASQEYRQELARNQLLASMSRKGNCYDNAAMESFWSTLKRELPQLTGHLTKRQVQLLVFEYIEAYYNRVRLHSSLGYKSPVDFENQSN